MPEWRHIFAGVAAIGFAHQFAQQAGAQTTLAVDSARPVARLPVEPVAGRIPSLVHGATEPASGERAATNDGDLKPTANHDAGHDAEPDAKPSYLRTLYPRTRLVGEVGETDRPSRSGALLSGLDDDADPLAFDVSRGLDEEHRSDPLRPRQGGAFELIESGAGDLSLGFGLIRAGETSAREKDRAILESRQLDVRGASGPVQVFDAGLGWRLQPGRDVTLSFEGGLRTLTRAGPDAHTDYAFADLGDEPITLPVVGASMQWDLLSGLQLGGGATGHMDDRQGTYVDVFAEARIDLTRSTDFVAGYRFLDASFESDRSRAELSQDALYAGIRIRY